MTRLRIGELHRVLEHDATGREKPSGTDLVVLDERADEGGLASAGLRGEILRVEVSAESQDLLIERIRTALIARAPQRLIGIGGGRLHDAVALARLGHASPAALAHIDARMRRNGPVLAPAVDLTASPRLVLAPTTIGPSSEVSSVACREHKGLRSLVLGTALRADLAIIDPRLTRSCSSETIREGAAEAVLRVLGARGGSGADAGADLASRQLVRTLVELGDAAASGTLGEDTRGRLSAASASTHHAIASPTARPFAAVHWYLANEIASVTGARKIPATVPLLAPLWAAAGSTRAPWLHADRIRTAWGWVADALDVDDDVGIGPECWARRWRLDRATLDPRGLPALADRIVRRWGSPLPALPGASVEQILALLTAGFAPAQSDHPKNERR